MKILRYILLSFLTPLLALTITFWIASYYRTNVVYYNSSSSVYILGVDTGKVFLAFEDDPSPTDPGFHIFSESNPFITELLNQCSTAQFGTLRPIGVTGILFPCWLLTLLLTSLSTLTLWRILIARKKFHAASAFPIAS